MTLEELKKEYGNENVFANQYALGRFVQEYGIRNKVKCICEKYSNEKIKRDPELYYDLAEDLLSQGLAFYNDGYYIVEDFDEIKSLKLIL